MEYIQSCHRFQVSFSSIDEQVEQESYKLQFISVHKSQTCDSRGEMALIMTVYNMKRCMNILGIATLIEKIKNRKPDYKGIARTFLKTAFLHPFTATQNLQLKPAA